MPTDEYFLKLLDAIRKAAGAKMMVTVEDLPEVVERLRLNADRYEKVRRMNVRQLAHANFKSMVDGIPFDKIIDGMKED